MEKRVVAWKRCYSHSWRATVSPEYQQCENCGAIRKVEQVQNPVKRA